MHIDDSTALTLIMEFSLLIWTPCRQSDCDVVRSLLYEIPCGLFSACILYEVIRCGQSPLVLYLVGNARAAFSVAMVADEEWHGPDEDPLTVASSSKRRCLSEQA